MRGGREKQEHGEYRLGIDFFGEEIDVKFENETKYINPQTGELVSTIPELLNKGEQQEYKRYDELKLYLELNASLRIRLKRKAI